MLRGTLSRWVLPFDQSTRLQAGQCSTPASVLPNMPVELRGRMTERQVHYLVNGANNVRQLVRIKIADDNDLLQVPYHTIQNVAIHVNRITWYYCLGEGSAA